MKTMARTLTKEEANVLSLLMLIQQINGKICDNDRKIEMKQDQTSYHHCN